MLLLKTADPKRIEYEVNKCRYQHDDCKTYQGKARKVKLKTPNTVYLFTHHNLTYFETITKPLYTVIGFTTGYNCMYCIVVDDKDEIALDAGRHIIRLKHFRKAANIVTMPKKMHFNINWHIFTFKNVCLDKTVIENEIDTKGASICDQCQGFLYHFAFREKFIYKCLNCVSGKEVIPVVVMSKVTKMWAEFVTQNPRFVEILTKQWNVVARAKDHIIIQSGDMKVMVLKPSKKAIQTALRTKFNLVIVGHYY